MLLIGAAIATLIVFIYIWLTWNFNYWKKLKIPSLEPQLFYGNVKDFVLMKKSKGLVYHDLYKKIDEPAVGIFSMRQPQWLIRDPALIKIITTNEFSNFKENDVYTEPSDFFFSTNVFFFSGAKWKQQRSIITPALTMSKLKLFLPHMVDVAKEMLQYLEENHGSGLEAKSFATLFTVETAMSYVYGVKCNSYKDPNSRYWQAFMEIFDPNWWNGFTFTFANIFPSLGHLFKIGLAPKSFIKFYLNVVKEAVEYKKKNNSQRKDFLQFLIDASGKNGVPELSVYEMTGLTMNIVADGTETTSAALSCVMDALTRYPEHQAKLREEIDLKIQTIEDITYENINSIKYLEAFISESLRILSPIPLLEKKCTDNCDIQYDGKTYSFKKGDKIALPIYSIQQDPKYFPCPMQFSPERFMDSDSEVLGFTPFGSGPRSCIGRKLAYMQMKVYLTTLLKFYIILPKEHKAPPIAFEMKSMFFLLVKGGVQFRFKKR